MRLHVCIFTDSPRLLAALAALIIEEAYRVTVTNFLPKTGDDSAALPLSAVGALAHRQRAHLNSPPAAGRQPVTGRGLMNKPAAVRRAALTAGRAVWYRTAGDWPPSGRGATRPVVAAVAPPPPRPPPA